MKEKRIGWAHEDMTLDEWLHYLFNEDYSGDKPFIYYHIPTNEMLNEYLSTIKNRSIDDVKRLLYNFLWDDCNFNNILDNIESTKKCELKHKSNITTHLGFLYEKLLVLGEKVRFFQGIRWVLDLLPDNPVYIINVLRAYYIAYFWYLPDGRLSGIEDSIAIIRTRFLEYIHPKDVLLNITDSDFEYLILALFYNMGYIGNLSKKSIGDGGKDILLEKQNVGNRELILVECKKYSSKKITKSQVKKLHSTVFAGKVSKGILVATTDFTTPAYEFCQKNPMIELINIKTLQQMLNSNFGTNWPDKIDKIILNGLKLHNKNKQRIQIDT